MSTDTPGVLQNDDERLYIELPDSVGDNLTATAHSKRGDIHIRIEEPWAGSTETGFGAITGVTLTKEQAIALANWILRKVS